MKKVFVSIVEIFFLKECKKNEPFAKAIITPTTKSETHDVLISPQEIVAQNS